MNSLLLWQILAGLNALAAVTALLSRHKLDQAATRQRAMMIDDREELLSENERLRDCLAKMQPRDLTR